MTDCSIQLPGISARVSARMVGVLLTRRQLKLYICSFREWPVPSQMFRRPYSLFIPCTTDRDYHCTFEIAYPLKVPTSASRPPMQFLQCAYILHHHPRKEHIFLVPVPGYDPDPTGPQPVVLPLTPNRVHLRFRNETCSLHCSIVRREPYQTPSMKMSCRMTSPFMTTGLNSSISRTEPLHPYPTKKSKRHRKPAYRLHPWL